MTAHAEPVEARIMAIWLTRLAVDRWRQAEACPEPGRRACPEPGRKACPEPSRKACPEPGRRACPEPGRRGCAAGEGADAGPVALIAETAHGPRIEAANEAGLKAGARPGMRLADARTLCPRLRVAPSDPAGDRAFLGRLAVWAQRWGPWAAVDAPDGLLVDVSAVAHLFGGEQKLLADALACLAARGLAARLAIAPTAGAAWALAHHGPARSPGAAILGSGEDIAARLAGLPVAALRLAPEALLALRRLGLERIGDLTARFGDKGGRDALKRRFRGRAPETSPLLRLDQLLGRAAEPLLPVVPVHPALVQRRLLEPLRHRELLDQVVADLGEDMARALEARGEGARRLELGLWRVDGGATLRHLELAAATRDAGHIARLFAAKLDDVDAGFGIELVRMRAAWAEPLAPGQVDLDAEAPEQGTSLATCIDRLIVRLGADAVRRPVLYASHIPERAQRWQGPLEPELPAQEELAFHTRPLKLLDRPEPIAVLYATPDGTPRRFRWRGGVHEVARVEGPERIAPEWWREKGTARLRDYYRIEDDQGRRYWIYRAGLAGDGRGGLPDWFLQGLGG